ncbi:MAG: EamA family transporter [Desulfobulbaceae bacterium]|nr:EamA family transporter [Candidatus Kapabacteria bacterium]MBS4000181.1 EamA family transporter [Desulfobulbaceae bacterium]
MIHFLILLQQVIASSTHIVAKGLTFGVVPSVVLFYRAAISCLVYIVWMSFKRKEIRKIDRKDIKYIIMLGIINIPLNQFLFLNAISMTTAPNVSLAYALTPAFVFVIAVVFLGERMNMLKTTGIVLAIIGAVILLSEKGFNFTSEGFKGDLLALSASFAWALYTILGKKITRKYGAIYATTLSMVTGFIFYVPIFFLLPGENNLTADLTEMNLLGFLYLGAVTSGIGYAIWYYALTKIDASKLAVFNNLQPVLTAAMAFFIFDTPITLYFISGAVTVITGVVLTQKG